MAGVLDQHAGRAAGGVSALTRGVRERCGCLGTTRGQQVANKSRDRVRGLVSHLPDSDSLASFDVRPALAVATDEDKDNWVRLIGDSIKALRKLRTQIQEEA